MLNYSERAPGAKVLILRIPFLLIVIPCALGTGRKPRKTIKPTNAWFSYGK